MPAAEREWAEVGQVQGRTMVNKSQLRPCKVLKEEKEKRENRNRPERDRQNNLVARRQYLNST